MTNKNTHWNLGAALTLAAVLGLSGTAAQAAVSIPEPAISTSTVDSISQPGSQALPSFVFNFDSNFDLIGFDVTIEFDPTKLSFNAAASTLTYGATTVTLPTALMAMQTGAPDFIYSPELGDFGAAIDTGVFSFNGTYLVSGFFPVPAGSSVIMTGVFDLLPGFDSGSTLVRVVGNAGDQFFNPLEEFDMTATVTAVPEPETWLMLIGGLGLIASQVRRRAKTQ